MEYITEFIRKDGPSDKPYCVYSHQTGKNFGCYPSKEAAKKRLQQMHQFSSTLLDRINKLIIEKYVTSTKLRTPNTGEQYIEFFVNPSKKEFLEVAEISALPWDPKGRAVRFFLDIKRKKVYIWSVNLFHSDAAPQLGLGYDYFKGRWIPGVATQVGGKWVFTGSDELESQSGFKEWQLKWAELGYIKKGDVAPDLKWADKYIDTKPWFNKFKNMPFRGE